ncbi:MAG: ComF family protein [Devosiaceae bacterium]|nr:ComF family protein [Devosiaceae bacterium]
MDKNTPIELLTKFMPALKQAGGVLLDQLYPPSCVHCGAGNLGGHGASNLLCAQCWGNLRPITRPLCPRLGLPFDFDLGTEGLSAQAIADPPPYQRARAACVHNGVARTLISKLKFSDRPELGKFCATLMVSAGHELFEDKENGEPPVLVPVPLHRRRQWQRRYNQSTQLAQALGALRGLDVEPFIVQRVKSTRPQIGLSAEQRKRNLAGAFVAQPSLVERLRGRRVVIVDDVITTGSTINALTKVLQGAGVERIDVISFSRVVIGIDDSL